MTIFLILFIVILLYASFGFYLKIERTAGRANKLYELLEDTQEKIENIDDEITLLLNQYIYVDWNDDECPLNSKEEIQNLILELKMIKDKTIREDNKKITWENHWKNKWNTTHEYLWSINVDDKYNDYKI